MEENRPRIHFDANNPEDVFVPLGIRYFMDQKYLSIFKLHYLAVDDSGLTISDKRRKQTRLFIPYQDILGASGGAFEKESCFNEIRKYLTDNDGVLSSSADPIMLLEKGRVASSAEYGKDVLPVLRFIYKDDRGNTRLFESYSQDKEPPDYAAVADLINTRLPQSILASSSPIGTSSDRETPLPSLSVVTAWADNYGYQLKPKKETRRP